MLMYDFFLSSRRRHTRCALVTGVQTCALPICKARERGHVLEGLAVALANIDDFITIIRAAPTPPVARQELMARSWDSSLVRDMLSRPDLDATVGRAALRPDDLHESFGLKGVGVYRLSETYAQDIRTMRTQLVTALAHDKTEGEEKDKVR